MDDKIRYILFDDASSSLSSSLSSIINIIKYIKYINLIIICAFGVKAAVIDNDPNQSRTFLALHMIKDLVTILRYNECVSSGIFKSETQSRLIFSRLILGAISVYAVLRLQT